MLLLLTTTILAIHLLAMNLASAGPLLCVWLCWGQWRQKSLRQRLGHRLARHSMLALLVGSALGFALLVMPPSAGMREALSRFPVQAHWFAGAELLFSMIGLWIYWLGCGPNGWCKTILGRWMHVAVALFSTTNLLYHFPPLMVVLAKLAATPAWIEAEVIQRSLFIQLMFQGEILARSTHFCLASLAVAAVAVLWGLSKQEKAAEEDAQWDRISRVAAGAALLFSLLQIPVGVWVLMTLPNRSLQRLIGGSSLGSVLFLAGIFSAMLLMQRLGVIAMGETSRPNLRRACRQMLLVILIMTATQQSARLSRSELSTNKASREDDAVAACMKDRSGVRATGF